MTGHDGRVTWVPRDSAVRGNWESLAMGPACDRGPPGFQHTLAAHWAEERGATRVENFARVCSTDAHVGGWRRCDVSMGSRPNFLVPDVGEII